MKSVLFAFSAALLVSASVASAGECRSNILDKTPVDSQAVCMYIELPYADLVTPHKVKTIKVIDRPNIEYLSDTLEGISGDDVTQRVVQAHQWME